MRVGVLDVLMRMDFSQFDRDERLAEARVTTLGNNLSGILKGAFSFTLGIGLLQGIKSFSGLAKDAVLTAGRTETLDVALQAVARSTGTSIAALFQQRDALMDLGIAEQEASQMLTRFMQAQVDTADAAKLARVAQDAAVVAGENSSEAAAKMTEAIAKQRPELLSAYGMTRNLNDIYNDYAKTLGKAVSQLSEAERKQAMLNYILEEGEKVAGTYERSMGSAFKKLGSLTRYVDTFKNAVARPLALPAFGVIIDAITDALKRGIAWAEANKAVLQAWGQAVSQAIQKVLGWAKAFAGFIATNWARITSLINLTVTAFLRFQVITWVIRGVSVAVTNLRLVTAALAGESLATSGILGFVSKVIGIYQMQIHLASLAGIAHVGVIEAVKTALWSLYAAIPAVGWALLAITAVLTGGIVAWGKYQQSLFKASQEKYAEQIRRSQEKIKQSQEQMADSTKKATKGTKDQAAALGKLGKAAQDNLQSFDEVHTLMEDMGDVPGLDVPGLDVPELDIDMPDLSAFDDMFDDMFEGFEQESASFQGFVGWLWDGIKEKFNGFKTWLGTTWLGGFWDGVKTTWSSFKEWAGGLWDSIKGIWGGFKDWVLGWAIPLWDGVKGAWGGFKDWVLGWAIPLWDGVKETWGGFKKFAADMWDGAKEKWTGFKDFAGNTWDGIKTTIQEKWNTLKTEAPLVWDNIKTTVSTSWNTLKTEAPIVWGNIKDSISTKWDELKTNAPVVWDNIKTTISTKWDELKTNAPIVWGNIKTTISTSWDELKTNAPVVWDNIKLSITDRFNAAKTSVTEAARNMRDNVPKSWGEMLTKLNGTKDTVRKAIEEPFTKAKETVLGIIDDAKNWGKNLMTNIKEGIGSKAKSVKNAITDTANTVKDFLGFSSPTREGPGRDADKWAPNLMKMYAEGILSGVSSVKNAADIAAQSLGAMAAAPRPAFGSAGAGSGFGATTSAAAAAGPAPEIHLHVGTLIADDYGLKKLEQKLRTIRIYEDQRVGDTR